MNLVLTGGMASPSAGGKALSPGRSSSPQRAAPPAPSPLPPSPSPASLAPVPSAAAAAAALSAAQQAQMIAHHALLMRQGADRDLFLHCQQSALPPMHYLPPPAPHPLAHLTAFNLNPLSLGHMKQFAMQQQLYLPLPRLLAPQSRPQLTLPPPAPAAQPAYHLAHLMSPLHHAMKRSYEHAFAATPADVAAKRHFAGYGPSVPTASLAHMPPPTAAYPHFYQGI